MAATTDVGRTVGRWRLDSALAEGHLGTVYRATPTEDGGDVVAIKILRADATAGDEAARRFEREALAASHIQHPNCVRVRDFGALDDGRPYLVMDLVQGKSLAQLVVDEGQIEVKRALGITAQVLRGLGEAHRAGVVHRGLQPSDVMLGEGDVPIIVDFGTAALTGGAGAASEPLTRAGQMLGPPAYLAPEQLGLGPAGTPVDARADLYAVTGILWEMLSGQPPYGSKPEDVVKRLAAGPVPELAQAAPEVPTSPGLDAVLARGLAINAAERFATAEEYLAAVGALIEGRLDPAMLGRPETLAPGRLAAPDPSKATTVFHGAPQPLAGAAGVAPPVAAPPSASLPPPGAGLAPPPGASLPPPVGAVPAAATVPPEPLPGASTSMPMPPSRSPASSRQRLFLLGGGALVLVIVIAALASHCSSSGKKGGDEAAGEGGLSRLTSAWEDAGLTPGAFAPIDDGKALGGGTCQAGTVSGLHVTVCTYRAPDQAAQARESGLAAVGDATGAALVHGSMLLVVSDPDKVDRSGKGINTLLKVFEGKDPHPKQKPPPTGKSGGK